MFVAIDQTTGFLTTDAFIEQKDSTCREGTNLVVVMMDLDCFRRFNETCGPLPGGLRQRAQERTPDRQANDEERCPEPASWMHLRGEWAWRELL